MFHSFGIKTLPNWVFAVLIGAFWLEYARQETVFVRFEAWLGLLVLSNLYLAVEKNTQGEWEWTAAHSYRCGFALVSALVILLSVGTGNLDGGATFWGLVAYVGANWALDVGLQKHTQKQADWPYHYGYAAQQADFEPLRIDISSLSERHLKWQAVLLCALMCLLGFWLTRLQAADMETTADKIIVVLVTIMFMFVVWDRWVGRNNAFQALKLLQEIDGEYLDIGPQGLSWQVLDNRASNRWEQFIRPQFFINKQFITWPQFKSVEVLSDGGRIPTIYLWLIATQAHNNALLTLHINETHPALSSKQLRQLLLQYHNLGMKLFHTVSNKST